MRDLDKMNERLSELKKALKRQGADCLNKKSYDHVKMAM